MCKALNKTRGLYGRWSESQVEGSVASTPIVPGTVPGTGLPVSREELVWTTTELRNALRSIEWDLEDLEDTIYILFIAINYDFRANIFEESDKL